MMKYLYCFFVTIFVFLYVSGHSQSKNLYDLSQGTLKNFHVLYDQKDKVYGYFVVYSKGQVTKTEKEFEFFVLDKNLKAVLNKTIKENILADNYYASLNYNDDMHIYPILEESTNTVYSDLPYPKSWYLDLKTNTLSEKTSYCFTNNLIQFCDNSKSVFQIYKERLKEKRKKGHTFESMVYKGKHEGFMVIHYEYRGFYYRNYTILQFDEDKKLKWKYVFDQKAKGKNYYKIKIVHHDSTHLMAFKLQSNYSTHKSASFLVWDTKTGELIKEEPITTIDASSIASMMSLEAEGTSQVVESFKSFDENLILTGQIRNGSFSKLGYFRCIIDKKTLALNFDYLYFEHEFKKHLPKIGKTGYLEKGYEMSIRDVFFLENGKIVYIFEKFKISGGIITATYAKNDDLIFVFTDENFKIKNCIVMEKEKSKFRPSNYLFSQYLNDSKDIAFFYKDYKYVDSSDDKNWVLIINTFIDNKLNTEEVTISSKEHVIYPYIAKEGYILLREFNEKAKYNQIRLEKLNF